MRKVKVYPPFPTKNITQCRFANKFLSADAGYEENNETVKL